MKNETFYSLLEKKTDNLVTVKQWESPCDDCGSHKGYTITTEFGYYDSDPIWLTDKLEDVKATLNGEGNNLTDGKHNIPSFSFHKFNFKIVKVTLNIEEV